MRVLFAVLPERAHFMPMVPVAWALRAAGHDVRVASLPGFTETITGAGLTAVPVGRQADLWTLIQRRDPDWVWEPEEGFPEPYGTTSDPARADWRHVRDSYSEIVETWHKPANFPLVTGLVEFARSWKPDLVLWEPLAFAGPIAAKACGAAHGRLLWSVDVFGISRRAFLDLRDRQPEGERADPLGEWLAGYGRKYGFEFSEDMVTGQFTLDQLPEALAGRAPGLDYLSTRYVPYGGRAVVPPWLREPKRRPRVALTLGISNTAHDAAHAVDTSRILRDLASLDAEIVATLPREEWDGLGEVPDNVRLVSYVPLAALAPTCDAVVNHAGLGTSMTMASHGVPQVLLPWDFDAPDLARRAAEHGGAIALHPRDAGDGAVLDAVRQLLANPGFRERADDLRKQIRSLPTPREVASRLEALADRHRALR